MLRQKLEKLEKILQKKNPKYLSNLVPSQLAIDWMQERLDEIIKGYHFSNELIDLYKWKNGSKVYYEQTPYHLVLLSESCFFNGWYFMSFEESIACLVRSLELFCYKKEYYFPILSTGHGAYMGVKLIPNGKTVALGVHIIRRKRTMVFKDQLQYESIATMIESLIQCYEHNAYYIGENDQFVCDVIKERKISKKLNPNSLFWQMD